MKSAARFTWKWTKPYPTIINERSKAVIPASPCTRWTAVRDHEFTHKSRRADDGYKGRAARAVTTGVAIIPTELNMNMSTNLKDRLGIETDAEPGRIGCAS